MMYIVAMMLNLADGDDDRLEVRCADVTHRVEAVPSAWTTCWNRARPTGPCRIGIDREDVMANSTSSIASPAEATSP